MPRNRLILRVARLELEPQQLMQDLSLEFARKTCSSFCWWDGPFKRWMQSLPLKENDILTRWVEGETFVDDEDRECIVKQLYRLDSKGLWRYRGTIEAQHISVLDHSLGYYVGIADYED